MKRVVRKMPWGWEVLYLVAGMLLRDPEFLTQEELDRATFKRITLNLSQKPAVLR